MIWLWAVVGAIGCVCGGRVVVEYERLGQAAAPRDEAIALRATRCGAAAAEEIIEIFTIGNFKQVEYWDNLPAAAGVERGFTARPWCAAFVHKSFKIRSKIVK